VKEKEWPMPESVPGPGNNDSHTDVPADSWLVRFRPWLDLIARLQVESCFRGKFDASDIVQQTLMEAWRASAQFRGKTEAERVAWLRQILARVLAHEVRRYRGTLKRNLHRERSIERSIDQSSRQLGAVLVSARSSPSEVVAKREQEVLLAEILEKIPADYREVIILRNLEGLTHEEVAERMGRSPGAVRMLWIRALQELRRHFVEDGHHRETT
jgi:RNA polymerase sigma-70 factor (ECF subfamily)